MRILAITTLLLFGILATSAQAAVPFLNATCPGGIEVHADAGGPVYVNGKEARLKTFNANYYETTYQRTTISISVNPDGSSAVSYTARGGANGVCTMGVSNGDPAAAPSSGLTASQMVAYCKGEASGQYNTRPRNVTASQPMRGTNGGFVVTGSVSLGAQGNPPFQCLFDGSGSFQSIDWL
ncbi:MAG: hypothetical protein JWP26_2252 [Devosia sp.]|uniref:hypothetical protein n=1 Tax=Devosia sp. TaxID=1871048 RepID=UPI00260435F8|nr:hypothetical protein [Devosia sp.]MDB5587282.1 hypothetical protein [Devosia sp.]